MPDGLLLTMIVLFWKIDFWTGSEYEHSQWCERLTFFRLARRFAYRYSLLVPEENVAYTSIR
jgi:hypothetical protein